MIQGSLAKRLRVLRAKRGLTLTEASAELGLNRHTLSRLEAGTQRASLPTIKKLAEGYGVPVEDLIVEIASPPTKSIDFSKVSTEDLQKYYAYLDSPPKQEEPEAS